MHNPTELAEKASQLFTLPDIYLRLAEMVDSNRAGANEIAELISLDAALSARLLRIANSSFYSFPAQIATIPRAVTLIGSRELCNLVLATSVASSFANVPQDVIDMDSFWRHNVDTSLVARHLGKKVNCPDVERIFTSGLLHNVGKLLVLTEMPDEAREAISLTEGQTPWQREKEVLGFTFAECGSELLRIWNLPDVMVESVRFQHKPYEAEKDPLAAALLHIGSRSASAMEQETKDNPTVDYLSLIDPRAWATAGASNDDLDEAMEFAQMEAWMILGLITSSLY